LLYPSGYEGEVNELLNTINEAEKWIRETEERTQTLRMVKNIEPNVKQIDIRVKVRKATIAAIVDCGADVDYINKAWCERQKFPVRELGDGWMEGYDAKKTRTKLQDAEVKFKYQGVTQTRRFRVVQETGTDIMVLGMPEMNPDVDWKERTVTLKKEASKVDEREIGTPVSRMKRVKNKNEDSNKTSHRNNEKVERGSRGGYGGDQVLKDTKEEKYQQELRETREKLPDELKKYAEVFCQKE